MQRLFLLGSGPLPFEQGIRTAAGLRTYQFLKPLLDQPDRFELHLVTIADVEQARQSIQIQNGSYLALGKDDPRLVQKVRNCYEKVKPDVVIAVNTFPSFVASKLDIRVTFWADLNGWIMAEAQAQAFKMHSNDYLPHYFEMEKSIIGRADKISAVSHRQELALLGELAWAGRLNAATFGYTFTAMIPNGTEWFEGEKSQQDPYSGFIEFERIPKAAFIALWVGGYNTWVDEVTLFEGLEKAMVEDKHLHFVSTGGAIRGLDNKTFSHFQELILASEFKDRFHFLGWVKTAQIPGLYQHADVGLNVDHSCLETLTGARNRINEMMKYGLPVITTRGSEIAAGVEENNAGIVVESGNSEEFARAIVGLAKLKKEHPEKFRHYGANGQKYIEEVCSYAICQKPLMEWLKNSATASDKGKILNLRSGNHFRAGIRYLRQNGLKKILMKLFHTGK